MRALILSLCLLPAAVTAQTPDPIVASVVGEHVLPGFDALARTSDALHDAAETDCRAVAPGLRATFGGAVDAWIGVSHLRFGPSETDNRAFALAFWPDSRGMTPRSLSQLIDEQDTIGQDAEDYDDMSIAARGLYALEFLLYDPDLSTRGDPTYRCTLIRTVTADIARTAHQIADDWHDNYADLMLTAGANEIYQSPDEARRALFGALDTGLEFTADTRLGRPLGTFDAPHPTRAEMRRSGRSMRNVVVSLQAMRQMAGLLAGDDPALAAEIDASFARALDQAASIDDPDFSGVADPQGRFRIEALQQRIAEIRTLIRQDLGPTLGVAAGFNSLDGD